MFNRGARIRARVWCFTPNPVFETKFEAISGRVVSSAGGKAHNVARQLYRWGVTAISVICDGGAGGEAWMAHAKKEGVKVIQIPVQTGMRQGWALLKEGVERIDFFTEDLKIGKSGWRKIRNFWIRNLKSDDWWVVAGSSATGSPKGWWRKLISDLQKKGVTVLVDSRGAPLREAVEAGADWIKCNLEEAEETTGLQGFEQCVRSLTGDGTTGVVVTLGEEGLVTEVNGTPFLIRAPKVKVGDATGSGDVVTAAVIYGEVFNWPIAQTLQRAAIEGTLHAMKENNLSTLNLASCKNELDLSQIDY
jgi:fructose-1-phosphate kinase PfkB-like protein